MAEDSKEIKENLQTKRAESKKENLSKEEDGEGSEQAQSKTDAPVVKKRKPRKKKEKREVLEWVSGEDSLEKGASGSTSTSTSLRTSFKKKKKSNPIIIEDEEILINNGLAEGGGTAEGRKGKKGGVEALLSRELSKVDLEGGANWRDEMLSREQIVVKLQSGKKAHQPPRKKNPRKSSQKETPTKRQDDNVDRFEEYMERGTAMDLLNQGLLIKGDIRINQKNYKEAYIPESDDGTDIAILGLADRNRALERDVVLVQIKPESCWQKQCDAVQKTGKVVLILEEVHTRAVVGLLKNAEMKLALLCPRDHRVPRLHIAREDLPLGVRTNPRQHSRTLFKGRITKWDKPTFATGVVEGEVGSVGDVLSEKDTILYELGLDGTELDSSLLPHIADPPPVDRADLRKKCIFSIDPESAKDLDDTLSIDELGGGLYEVGVHISDLSYFIEPESPLDKAVMKRATSIYLVDAVIHMLPPDLTLSCSLLPGEDKMAISVIFTLDSEAKVVDTKFTRSIINSCAKLTYDHAQAFLEGREVELPTLFNGFTEVDIRSRVVKLGELAKKMRDRSYCEGRLSIYQPIPRFFLDSNLIPTEVSVYPIKDSNRLVEEFMLLANHAVAQKLGSEFPGLALLRRHSPPKMSMLDKTIEALHKVGIFLDGGSSGSLHNSILEHSHNDSARNCVISNLVSKVMNRAVYFCYEEGMSTVHYALSMEFYTHFTSPIRRYADLMVHRLLSASLGHTPVPTHGSEYVAKIAERCNKQKYNSKKAEEKSRELYASLYVRQIGQLTCTAVVNKVMSYSFEALVTTLAINVRVYVNELKGGEAEFEDNELASCLKVHWKGGGVEVIQLFSEVLLCLRANEAGESLTIEPTLIPRL